MGDEVTVVQLSEGLLGPAQAPRSEDLKCPIPLVSSKSFAATSLDMLIGGLDLSVSSLRLSLCHFFAFDFTPSQVVSMPSRHEAFA